MSNREYVKYQDIKFYCHPKYKYYLASRCGQILSLKRKKKKILKLVLNSHGYFYFNLFENNKHKFYYVHRYVFETFKGKIPKGIHTDHCDNNKKNNSIKNLQLLSPKENSQKSCCKKVNSLNLETNEKKIFDSLSQASEFYQIIQSSITLNCQKKIKFCKSKRDGKKYQFFYL